MRSSCFYTTVSAVAMLSVISIVSHRMAVLTLACQGSRVASVPSWGCCRARNVIYRTYRAKHDRTTKPL